ncbi:hypothetical protein MC885_003660 [Smutsia gigantea]|nr:hypothetical protein MC885_003660 [Smutsia gigantea]
MGEGRIPRPAPGETRWTSRGEGKGILSRDNGGTRTGGNVVGKSEQAGSSQQGQPQPRHLETPCSGHCLVPPEVPAEAAPKECQLLEPAASYPLHQPHTLRSRSSRLLPFPEEEALKLKQLLIYKPIFP